MAGLTHAEMVTLGGRWLRREGFGVVATELSCHGSQEQPDVIGFRSTCSAIIECKVSRSDFLADRAKPHRQKAGVGVYRFFLCPDELIAIDEVPPTWGLLYASGRSVRSIIRPLGNAWPGLGRGCDGWRLFQNECDGEAERMLLYSVARRLSLKAVVQGRSA